MLILGIDPGTINCGYAILRLEKNKISLVEAGLIKIKTRELQFQIAELVEGLDSVLKDRQIDEVAIEDMFYAHNPKTVIKLAQFRGALALKIIQEIGNFYEYTPLQVKKALTVVKMLLGIKEEIKPLDITDAIAVAITHSQRVGLRK